MLYDSARQKSIMSTDHCENRPSFFIRPRYETALTNARLRLNSSFTLFLQFRKYLDVDNAEKIHDKLYAIVFSNLFFESVSFQKKKRERKRKKFTNK